jgi:hypothetical protein
MMETYDICVWPDEEWCHGWELVDYSHKSDNYQTLKIPENFDPGDVELVIAFLSANGKL